MDVEELNENAALPLQAWSDGRGARAGRAGRAGWTVCVIIRLLPLVRNDPHYQGKSEEGTIRALVESQIRTARPGAPDRSLVLADG